MTEASSHMIAQVMEDMRANRVYMQNIARDAALASATSSRIEAQVQDLREDHDRVVVEMKKTDRVMMGRICKIEDQAVWVRGWAAGAAAAVGVASGAFIWLVFKLPSAVDAVKHLGGE